MCCLGSTIAPCPKTEIQKPLSHGKKLFLIDLITSTDYEAFRPDTGFSTQDIVGFLLAAVMGALWYLSAEDELDWESLLADDDDEEE